MSNIPDHVPENFCVLPFVSLEARTNGDVSPCCIMQDSAPVNLSRGDSFIDVWNSDWMNSYREAFKNNEQPEACKNCWMEEKSGLTSKRLRELDYYRYTYDFVTLTHTPEPVSLDIKLGNICNTKCRICTSFASSQWGAEEIAQDPLRKDAVQQFNKQGQWPKKNELFWDEIDSVIHNITKIEFFGGEPLLIDKHYAILERCVELGVAENIEICYNTNGSIYPHRYIELYTKFKNVKFFFSIDGVDQEFNYLRHPNKFDDVLQNLRKFLQLSNDTPSIEVKIFQTISALNMCTLEALTDYCAQHLPIEIHYNMVFTPEHISPKVLPAQAKKRITAKYKDAPEYIKNIVNFMNSEDYGSDKFAYFVKTTKFSDNYRNESFVATFPELYELIKHEWKRIQ